LLAKARDEQTTNYDFYQQSVALFTDALSKWPENDRATRGDLEAREAFAELARKKGDFDLGLEVLVNTSEPRLVKLAAALQREKTVRKVVRTTWTVLFAATALMLVVSVHLLNKNGVLQGENAILEDSIRANREALTDAEVARKAADDAKKAAEDQATTAVAEAKKADENRAQAEETARVAIDKAKAAEQSAITTRMKADEDVMKAKDAVAMAETRKADAEKKAVEAQAKTTAAEEKQKLTEANASRREATEKLNTLVSRIESSYELRDYTRVLAEAREAIGEIRKMLENPLFASEAQWLQQQEKSLQDKLDRAARSAGTGQAAFPGNSRPVLSAISPDGRTFASIFNPEAADGLRRIEFRSVAENVQPLDVAPTDRLEFPVTETRGLVISASGNAACLTGPAVPFLWIHREGQGWKQLQLNVELPPASEPVRMIHAHFAPNSQRLYLIGDDRAASLQIFDLSSDTPRPLLPTDTTLFLRENANYRCSNSALLPDESAILVCSRSGRDHQLLRVRTSLE
jgi:chemotaxis protein histidine kinase CheA